MFLVVELVRFFCFPPSYVRIDFQTTRKMQVLSYSFLLIVFFLEKRKKNSHTFIFFLHHSYKTQCPGPTASIILVLFFFSWKREKVVGVVVAVQFVWKTNKRRGIHVFMHADTYIGVHKCTYWKLTRILFCLCLYYSEELKDRPLDLHSLEILKHKLKQLGIDISACVSGHENRLMCPSVFSFNNIVSFIAFPHKFEQILSI